MKDYKYVVIIDKMAYCVTEKPVTAWAGDRVIITAGDELTAVNSSYVIIPYEDFASSIAWKAIEL